MTKRPLDARMNEKLDQKSNSGRFQFSILRLLALLTFLAFSLATLFTFSDPLVGLAIWLVTNAYFTLAITMLIYGSGERRAFVIGGIIGLSPAVVTVFMYSIDVSWEEDFPTNLGEWEQVFANGGEHLRWYAGSWILSIGTGVQAVLFRRFLANRE